MNQFLTLLRIARNKSGVTQIEFGQQLGIQQKTLSNYENGERDISIADFFRIIKAGGAERELIEMLLEQNVPEDINSRMSGRLDHNDLSKIQSDLQAARLAIERVEKILPFPEIEEKDSAENVEVKKVIRMGKSNGRGSKNKPG